MEKTHTIVLYGASLSVAAIGAGLADKPDWHVIPMDAVSPAATRVVCTNCVLTWSSLTWRPLSRIRSSRF